VIDRELHRIDPTLAGPRVRALIERCLSLDAEERPTANQLCLLLQQIMILLEVES